MILKHNLTPLSNRITRYLSALEHNFYCAIHQNLNSWAMMEIKDSSVSGDQGMPDQLVVLASVAGIVLVGLAFTAIDLVKDAGRLIALGLLAFLGILLLNRTLPSSEPYSPNAYSSPDAYSSPNTYSPNNPPSTYSPNTYPPNTYPPNTYSPGNYPPGTAPSQPFTTDNPAAPNQAPSSSFGLDEALNGISRFVQSVFTRIDEFVYGEPYAVNQQPQPLQPDSSQQPAQPSEPGYQIRPDGVPSRVSTPVESAPTTRPTSTTGSRPIPALW